MMINSVAENLLRHHGWKFLFRQLPQSPRNRRLAHALMPCARATRVDVSDALRPASTSPARSPSQRAFLPRSLGVPPRQFNPAPFGTPGKRVPGVGHPYLATPPPIALHASRTSRRTSRLRAVSSDPSCVRLARIAGRTFWFLHAPTTRRTAARRPALACTRDLAHFSVVFASRSRLRGAATCSAMSRKTPRNLCDACARHAKRSAMRRALAELAHDTRARSHAPQSEFHSLAARRIPTVASRRRRPTLRLLRSAGRHTVTT